MRGNVLAITAQHRPMGRDLEEPSQHRDSKALHVDRFCYIGRRDHGGWAWQCALCPLPLRLATVAAGNWRDAIDEATRHLRTHAQADDPDDSADRTWTVAA